jgi:TPR repeat protein
MSRTFVRLLSLALAGLFLPALAAHAQSGLGPADAQATLGSLRYKCALAALCPLSSFNYSQLERAVGGDRVAQYFVGLNLTKGEGVPLDRQAGLAWIAKSAEAGMPLAADWIERGLQNGEDIDVDETKVAKALKSQADAGNAESARVLALMTIRGRGVAQDPQAGVALMLKSAERSAGGEGEFKIAQLYLVGTNGLPRDHAEAMKWYTRAAERGHLLAMATLGSLWEKAPMADLIEAMKSGQFSTKQRFEPDVVQSYCWRARAAEMGSALAQYELALMLTRQSSDSRGNVIEPDLVLADFWFRLGARSPEYNNSQVRAAIEPKLTTVQLDRAKKMVTAWRELDFGRMKAATLSIPGKEGRTCPPMP